MHSLALLTSFVFLLKQAIASSTPPNNHHFCKVSCAISAETIVVTSFKEMVYLENFCDTKKIYLELLPTNLAAAPASLRLGIQEKKEFSPLSWNQISHEKLVNTYEIGPNMDLDCSFHKKTENAGLIDGVNLRSSSPPDPGQIQEMLKNATSARPDSLEIQFRGSSNAFENPMSAYTLIASIAKYLLENKQVTLNAYGEFGMFPNQSYDEQRIEPIYVLNSTLSQAPPTPDHANGITRILASMQELRIYRALAIRKALMDFGVPENQIEAKPGVSFGLKVTLEFVDLKD